MVADESYAGASSFYKMEKAIQDIMGFEYVLPVHQGRAAEHIISKTLIKQGNVVPGNALYSTTQKHILACQGKPIDCTIDEGYDPESEHPFKGNIDTQKLKQVLEQNKNNVSYIIITVTCISNGGQPVSMENIKQVAQLAKQYNVLLFFDACRCCQNAYFIKKREEGFQNKTIKEILKEMMSYSDGMYMSSKKDGLVNIGGFIALRDKELYLKMANFVVMYEGYITYGGMSGRAMESIAIGLYEGIDENFLRHHIEEQVIYLGSELQKRGIPIVKPIGGHSVYIDAQKFLPHIPAEQFPGQALAIEVYIEGGIRGEENGSLIAGRDPITKQNIKPKFELYRLAVPRRVYCKSHLDYVVEIVQRVWNRRNQIRGIEFVYEPPNFRHSMGKFKWVEK